MKAYCLFDAFVQPIVSYVGFVWAPLCAHQIKYQHYFINICNDFPIEPNVKLCKYILGTHKSSTNNAVKGELGRYPLPTNIIDHTVRYFNRIDNLNNTTLVTLSCMDDGVL